MKSKYLAFIFITNIAILTTYDINALFWWNSSEDTKKANSQTQTNDFNTSNNEKNGQIINNVHTTSSVNITLTDSLKLNLKDHMFRLKDLKNNTGDKVQSLLTYTKNNKWFLFKSALIGSYIALQSSLIYLSQRLSKDNCWSNWKKHLDLEDLYQVSQDQLAKDLLNDIQKKYITIKNPTDFIMPLIKFMKDIEKEEQAIAIYKKITKIINKTYIVNWLFFYNKKLYSAIDFREKRLKYIKNSFLSWLANFKINTNIQKL